MNKLCRHFAWSFSLIAVGILSPSLTGAAEGDADAKPAKKPDKKALLTEFEQKLSGATLVGQFTVLGKPGKLQQERYEITSVRKMPQGDYWTFNAKIKYGGKNIEVPLPLEVKWAGDTPVITVNNFTIPGLGTFTSRVVIYKNKYCGTWTHDNVGGHLFGTIEPAKKAGGKDKDSDQPTP